LKRSICFLLVLLSLMTFWIPVDAQMAEASGVDDRYGMFSSEEIEAISAVAAEESQRAGCSLYIATFRVPRGLSSTEAQYTGEMFLTRHGLSKSDDLVLLVVTYDENKSEYFYNLYTYGKATKKINDKEVDYILDHDDVWAIKEGFPASGCQAFLRLAAKGYLGRLGASYLKIAIISFVIALTFGLIVCGTVYASYKQKQKSTQYPLDRYAKLELTESADRFAGTFVTKRVIQTGSNGGGGGSSHGGGGGHRGGR